MSFDNFTIVLLPIRKSWRHLCKGMQFDVNDQRVNFDGVSWGFEKLHKNWDFGSRKGKNLLRKDIVAKLSLVYMIFKAKTHNLHSISMLELYSQTHDMDSALGMKCCIFIFNLGWIKNFVKQLLIILLLPFSSFSYF